MKKQVQTQVPRVMAPLYPGAFDAQKSPTAGADKLSKEMEPPQREHRSRCFFIEPGEAGAAELAAYNALVTELLNDRFRVQIIHDQNDSGWSARGVRLLHVRWVFQDVPDDVDTDANREPQRSLVEAPEVKDEGKKPESGGEGAGSWKRLSRLRDGLAPGIPFDSGSDT